MAGDDLERLEIELLLEAIQRRYAFDFRGYAYGSLRRRLWRRVFAEGTETISGLQEVLLHDPPAMERLLADLSVNVTTMFRDPGFFRAFRDKAIPLLRTYPFIRIWNAGCSTGEETYSVAILMHEAGLYERTRIYATDLNEPVLHRAREARYPLDRMRDYTTNYLRSGGQEEFSSYYTVSGEEAVIAPELTRNVIFGQHNLSSDRSFNEFNAILCRNVLIYFGKELQERVHGLFHESLADFGILGLGQKESMRFSRFEECYEELDGPERLYRRVR